MEGLLDLGHTIGAQKLVCHYFESIGHGLYHRDPSVHTNSINLVVPHT